jgi:methionine-gamma-lyase
MHGDNKKFPWKNVLPNCKPTTRVLSAGYDPILSEMSAKTPIFPTSTFLFKSAGHGERFFRLLTHPEERGANEDPGLIYSRMNNPNMEIVEDKMVVMEPGAEDAAVLPRGCPPFPPCAFLFSSRVILSFTPHLFTGEPNIFSI